MHDPRASRMNMKLGRWLWKLVFFATFLLFMRVLLINVYSQKSNYSDYLLRSLQGPLKYDDPELIQYIRDNILEPPSTLPYNFHAGLYKRGHASEKFYDFYNDKFFKFKRNGFFIEAGALDGQSMSNTLLLEMKQGWSGLLVEPDPSNYISLKRKHRKAWTARTCLSIAGYPKKERLSSRAVKHINGDQNVNGRAMGGIMQEKNQTFFHNGREKNTLIETFYERQCFPLGSLLLALNVTHVDLLSLDVEHFERYIIENFDFSRFNIQVLYMEWWDFSRLLWLKTFMENRGFYFVKNIAGDIIFVREDSEARRIVDENHLRDQFIVFYSPNSTNNDSS